MPQGRIVLKSICQSKKLAALKTDGARLLYTWLIPNLDVNGCFHADPEILRGQIFTRLKKTNKAMRSYLDDLVNAGLVVVYKSNEDIYLHVPDFADKQPRLNPKREGEPTIPPPTPDQLTSNSRVTPPEVKESKVKESKVKESKVKGKKEYSQNSSEFRLAKLLFDEIRKRKSDYKKPNLQKWAEHIDLMIRIDNRKPQKIANIIAWCQQDDFWQNNILSTTKLRRHFDKLEMLKNARSGKDQSTGPHIR